MLSTLNKPFGGDGELSIFYIEQRDIGIDVIYAVYFWYSRGLKVMRDDLTPQLTDPQGCPTGRDLRRSEDTGACVTLPLRGAAIDGPAPAGTRGGGGEGGTREILPVGFPLHKQN